MRQIFLTLSFLKNSSMIGFFLSTNVYLIMYKVYIQTRFALLKLKLAVF